MPRGRAETAEILLVEDNPVDQKIAQQLFRGAAWVSQLHVVGDGESALSFLRREDIYAKAPRPDLIIMDLNLPGKHGQDVLRELKHDPDLFDIPVIVLSASSEGRDLSRSYDLGASCYLPKPQRPEGFRELLRRAEDCWIHMPRKRSGWSRLVQALSPRPKNVTRARPEKG